MRHGESENNKKQLYTGWFDTPLTEHGKEEAHTAGAIMRKIHFDKIYSSDLIRARQTAECAIPNCGYETSPLLREIKMGSLENKPISSLAEKLRAEDLIYGYTKLGGESRTEFRKRVIDFKAELETLDCQRVAIFSHAGWLRCFLSEITGASISAKNVCCNNCAVAIFEYKNSTWRLHSLINSI